MMTAYGLTSLELYRGVKFEMTNRKSNKGTKGNKGENHSLPDLNISNV